MPFNIETFKQALPGGGARNNMYRVRGVIPTGVERGSNLEFVISAAQVPAVSVDAITVNFQGRPLNVAGERRFTSPWSITVLNDVDYVYRKAFERWSELINTHSTNISPGGAGGSSGTYTNYFAEWKVEHFSRDNFGGKPDAAYFFHGCWPSAISAIDLNYEPATSIESFTVDLQYQYYTIADVADDAVTVIV